jgi:hypothetical protein
MLSGTKLTGVVASMKKKKKVKVHITLCHVNTGVWPSNSALSKDLSYIRALLCCVSP